MLRNFDNSVIYFYQRYNRFNPSYMLRLHSVYINIFLNHHNLYTYNIQNIYTYNIHDIYTYNIHNIYTYNIHNIYTYNIHNIYTYLHINATVICTLYNINKYAVANQSIFYLL